MGPYKSAAKLIESERLERVEFRVASPRPEPARPRALVEFDSTVVHEEAKSLVGSLVTGVLSIAALLGFVYLVVVVAAAAGTILGWFNTGLSPAAQPNN